MAVALGEVHGLVLEVEVGLGLGYGGPVGYLVALVQAVGVAVVEEGEDAGQQGVCC